tara:strand:+ start:148 stop:1479 length:1332 start_codon:yes stop_codon:yes gene_type:complete
MTTKPALTAAAPAAPAGAPLDPSRPAASPWADRLQALGLGCLLLLAPTFSVLVPKGLVPLLLVGSLLFLLGCWQARRRLLAPPLDLSLLFGALVVWTAIGLLWTLLEGGLSHMAGLAVLLLAGLLLAAQIPSLTERQKAQAQNLLLIGFALGLGVLIFEGLTGRWLLYTFGEPREWGYPISRLNRGATALALFAWPVAVLLHRGSRPWLVWPMVAITLAVLSNFESLAATVGFGAGALLLVIARLGPRLARLLLLLGMLLALLTPSLLTKQLHQLGVEQDLRFEYSLRHRVYIWNFVTDRWLEKPLWGWGFNSSKVLPIGDTKPFSPGLKHPVPSHPHNFALQVLAELGLPGLLLVTLLAIALWRRLEPGGRDGGAELALTATAVIILMTAYGAWQGQWIANLFLAATFAYLARQSPARPAASTEQAKPADKSTPPPPQPQEG